MLSTRRKTHMVATRAGHLLNDCWVACGCSAMACSAVSYDNSVRLCLSSAFSCSSTHCCLSSVGWQYRRQYRKLPALHGPRSLEADENGLHLVSSHADSRFSWQVLERSAENDRVFILVQQGGRIFFPIAKRQLTLEQTAGLRELFAQHISSK